MGTESTNSGQPRFEDSAARGDRSFGEELTACLGDWVDRRQGNLASQVDAVAIELTQASRNLAGRQPGTAALLRLFGSRLGAVAATLDERPIEQHLRDAVRVVQVSPVMFLGGLVGGAVIGAWLGRTERARKL
ncbi:MAG: hypothetical protein RL417_1637 [Pseudomonadota bacterium]|jgi:hypothetical protein